MANAKVEKTVNIVLSLTEVEAKYLYRALQHCPYDVDIEGREDKECRSDIWHALHAQFIDEAGDL